MMAYLCLTAGSHCSIKGSTEHNRVANDAQHGVATWVLQGVLLQPCKRAMGQPASRCFLSVNTKYTTGEIGLYAQQGQHLQGPELTIGMRLKWQENARHAAETTVSSAVVIPKGVPSPMSAMLGSTRTSGAAWPCTGPDQVSERR